MAKAPPASSQTHFCAIHSPAFANLLNLHFLPGTLGSQHSGAPWTLPTALLRHWLCAGWINTTAYLWLSIVVQPIEALCSRPVRLCVRSRFVIILRIHTTHCAGHPSALSTVLYISCRITELQKYSQHHRLWSCRLHSTNQTLHHM